MAAEPRLQVIAYDVSCDQRRSKLEKLVSRWAVRVQYSVFEGRMTEGQVRSLLRQGAALLDSATDSLRVYHLCSGCECRGAILGKREPVPPDGAEIVV